MYLIFLSRCDPTDFRIFRAGRPDSRIFSRASSPEKDGTTRYAFSAKLFSQSAGKYTSTSTSIRTAEPECLPVPPPLPRPLTHSTLAANTVPQPSAYPPSPLLSPQSSLLMRLTDRNPPPPTTTMTLPLNLRPNAPAPPLPPPPPTLALRATNTTSHH